MSPKKIIIWCACNRRTIFVQSRC